MIAQISADINRLRFKQDLPPGPGGLPWVGQLFNLQSGPLKFLENAAREYGDILFVEVAGKPIYVVNRPEYIQELLINQAAHLKKALALQLLKPLFGEGLLTSEGDFHKRQKKLAAPAFARAKLVSYAETMIEEAEQLVTSLANPKQFDMHEAMMELTLKIVAKTLFGSNVAADTVKVAESIEAIMALTERILDPLGSILNALPTPKTLRFRAAIRDLDEIIYRIIAEKRAQATASDDLLTMLMAARYDDGSAMSDKQLRDECLTLFLAGHETTANALSWTWYLLSQHADVRAKLEAEWSGFREKPKLTAEDYPQLVYTRQVISESFRLYPPAWIISREVSEAIEIGGYTLPKGAVVLMSQWAVHRNEKYWPNALRFDPDRFAAHESETRHKFTFFPFGGGVRQCIGDQFAWMEAVLLLATLGRKFRFEYAEKKSPQPEPLITLRPKGGLRMTVSPSS